MDYLPCFRVSVIMPRIWLVIKLHVVYSTITIFDITAIAQQ